MKTGKILSLVSLCAAVVVLGGACDSDVGATGRAPVMRTEPVSPGAECREGGVAVLLYEGDALLSREVICHGQEGSARAAGIHYGAAVLSSADDVARLGDVRVITGDLWVVPAGLEELRLSHLESVGGSLVVAADGELAVIDLPALRWVGGSLRVTRSDGLTSFRAGALETLGDSLTVLENPALDELLVPSLRFVGAQIRVVSCERLAALSFPALEQFSGHLLIRENRALASIDGFARIPVLEGLRVGGNAALERLSAFPALEWCGVVHIHNQPALTTVELPALVEVEARLGLEELPALAALDLGKLTTAGVLALALDGGLEEVSLPALHTLGALSVYGTHLQRLVLPVLHEVDGTFEVSYNGQLEAARFPALRRVTGPLYLSANPVLHTLELPRLETVGWTAELWANAELCESEVHALKDALGGTGWDGHWVVFDNKPDC